MPQRKYITPGTKVGLKLTVTERKLILNDLLCLDETYAQVLRGTPTGHSVQFTLDEWEDFGGYIAAEANHTDDKKLGKKLDTIFSKIQKLLDTHTDEEPPKTLKIEDARKAKLLSDQAVQIAEWAAKALVAAERLGIKNKRLEHFCLSPAQRDVLLLVPGISKAIKGKLAKEKTSVTLAEVGSMIMALAEDLPDGDAHKQVAVLLVAKHLIDRLQEGIVGVVTPAEKKHKSPKAKTTSATVYQFKITLKGIKPPIWRRIQTKDCTLDKLHEHIQTAMGWTNSHLHQFRINGVLHGDPELLCEGWEDEELPVNSLQIKISKIVPEDGKRFRFEYKYDFGDGWEHEILFEGCLRAEKGTRYPLCVEGERACPPEDVGGIYGYQEYLEALADPNHERHDEFMAWSGPFDPEAFDAQTATKDMRKGLPNWREME
jgi:hypothetical protein